MAVWCLRLALICVGLFVFHPHSVTRFVPVVVFWAGAAVLMVATFVLLRVAGIPFDVLVLPVGLGESEILRQFRRDLVWLPPR